MEPSEKEQESPLLANSPDLGSNLVHERRQLAEDLAWLILRRLRHLTFASEVSTVDEHEDVK